MDRVKADVSQPVPIGQRLTVEYCRLTRQLAVSDLEHDFVNTATAIGIAERAQATDKNV